MAPRARLQLGERFGRLVVIAPGGFSGRWLCRCDCGSQVTVVASRLRDGEVKSCGCLRRETLASGGPAPTSAGDRYGRLVVLAEAGRNHRRERVYLCRCDCGNELEVVGASLRRGATRSCGCLARDQLTERLPQRRHGHARGKPSPTYVSWQSMVGRCTRPTNRSWARYGGRGITVCERWRRFENFLADMGERPEGTTLDRLDPDGNYEPGNCRWATDGIQARDHGRGPVSGKCRKGLHDITEPGSTIRDSDGTVRCRACRLEGKRRSRAKRS